MTMRLILHPLLVMNIADHQARKVSEMGSSYNPERLPRCLGAIFGQQSKQTVEVFSSVELTFEIDKEGHIRMDAEAFAEDVDLYKQIYPEHECLGWYSTARQVQPEDLVFHKRFSEYNESPLYILMDPVVRSDAKALPVGVFRSQLRKVGEQNRLMFVDIPFKVISSPSETVTIGHIIQDRGETTQGSQIVPEFMLLERAVTALRNRVALLVEYLAAVQAGAVKQDLEIMRDIESVCNRLPLMASENFGRDFFNEMSNGMMMTYLASMTKAAAKVTTALELSEQLGESSKRGGRRQEMGVGMGMGAMMPLRFG